MLIFFLVCDTFSLYLKENKEGLIWIKLSRDFCSYEDINIKC